MSRMCVNIEKAKLTVRLKTCIALKCKMSDIFMDEDMIALAKKYQIIRKSRL